LKHFTKALWPSLLRSRAAAGFVAGCVASVALHGGLFAMATWIRSSPVFAGWRGSDSFGSDDTEPPTFSISVRVGRGDGQGASTNPNERAGALVREESSEFSGTLVVMSGRLSTSDALAGQELSPAVSALNDSIPTNAALNESPPIRAALDESLATHSAPHDSSAVLGVSSGVVSAVAPPQGGESAPESVEAPPTALSTPASPVRAPTGESIESSSTARNSDDARSDASKAAGTAVAGALTDGAPAGGSRDSAPVGGDTAGSPNGDRATHGKLNGSGMPGTAVDGTEQRPVFSPKPPYPPLSKRLGEEGQVRVQFTVAHDGKVLSVVAVKSSGHPRLDRAAIETLMRWRFTPLSSSDGRATSSVLHTVTFRLQ
jgi:protein TonB